MPRRLVLVAGTGTEVGKTWVAVRLIETLRAGGRAVAARKPVQSFEPDGSPNDAERLAAASGELPEVVCPAHRSYPLAMTPFMAAAALGRPPFALADLLAELVWPPGADVAIVESAGGVRSPICSDGADTVDLADALSPDLVVLVADGGLGTLNAVRLSVEALAGHPVTVVLNRFSHQDPVHVANRDWLSGHLGVPVTTDVGDLV